MQGVGWVAEIEECREVPVRGVGGLCTCTEVQAAAFRCPSLSPFMSFHHQLQSHQACMRHLTHFLTPNSLFLLNTAGVR